MKTAIMGIFIAAALPSAASAADVTIDLTGIRAAEGDLYVSLQTREQFLKPTGSYGTIVAKPAAGARSIILPGVAPGRYSVSVWHDNNANKQFDRQPNGEPIDGWAMINGDAIRAAPVFENVSFVVGQADQTLKLGMIYGR